MAVGATNTAGNVGGLESALFKPAQHDEKKKTTLGAMLQNMSLWDYQKIKPEELPNTPAAYMQ